MRFFHACLAATALLVAGCDREATGQVAAVVNGEEITLQEVNAELGAAEIPEGAEREKAQQAALQRIVDRRLLAQAARTEGLDQDPDYLLKQRQLDEALLVQLFSQKLDRAIAVPSEREVDAFIKDNPGLFEGRMVYTIDRIQFPMPADRSVLQALEDDHSMDAVAAKLQSLGIQFQRQPAQMDSARLGQERVNRILSLPKGEPFLLPEGGIVTVASLTGQQPAPISGADARPIAVQAMRNRSLSDSIRQRLEAEKAKAEIKYQSTLAPEPASSTPASGASRS
jgi:peptidyl-prolyl cis-trans isomerase C